MLVMGNLCRILLLYNEQLFLRFINL